MPTASEIREEVASELRRRRQLSVPTLAGGVLYLLGAIILVSTTNSAPTVGVLQGLAPAISGRANPPESPRALELRYLSHHAFALIAGSFVTALALGALTAALLLIFDAARFRRPETWAPARALVLVGGISLAVVTVAREVTLVITAHNFALGHDHSNHAVEHVLTKGTAVLLVGTLGPVAWLVFVVGIFPTLLNALRVGLMHRWMAFVGMFASVLILLGGAELEVVPAFWMVALGILLAGRWPNGDPPAWEAGEARPWPSSAEQRAARQRGRGATAKPVPAASAPAPAPAAPAATGAGSRRRRRKGRGR